MQKECDKSLVDSNILVYLVDSEEKERQISALKWFEENSNKKIFVAAQNLREFSFRALLKSVSIDKINEFLNLFSARFIVLQDDYYDIKRALELCKNNKNLFWDANIVSVMLHNEIDCIYTENVKDFQKLGVKAINPLK